MNLYRFCAPSKKNSAVKRIVILGFGGIGNHVAITPALQSLKTAYPNARMIFLASSKTCVDLLKNEPTIDTFQIMDIGHMQSFNNYAKAGKKIRESRPDVVIAAAGTDPVKGSCISFFSKANIRIGEDWHGRGFLYTHRIKVDLGISEVEQNTKLVHLISENGNTINPRIILTPKEVDEAKNWFGRLNIPVGRKVVGIHPGSGAYQRWKRWDLDNFIKVSNELSFAQKAIPIFFLGPEDKGLFLKLKKETIPNLHLSFESESIRKTAAKINCCDLFLSNDSGLRHIAASLNVKTIGVFGPTIREKNAVSGDQNKIIYSKNVQCSPCHYTSWYLSCGDLKPCLKDVSIKQVLNAVTDFI